MMKNIYKKIEDAKILNQEELLQLKAKILGNKELIEIPENYIVALGKDFDDEILFVAENKKNENIFEDEDLGNIPDYVLFSYHDGQYYAVDGGDSPDDWELS